MGYGLHSRLPVGVVSFLFSICLAAKYLLDLYSVVRILLVNGKTETEAGTFGLWSRTFSVCGNNYIDSTAEGDIWSAYPVGSQYAAYAVSYTHLTLPTTSRV